MLKKVNMSCQELKQGRQALYCPAWLDTGCGKCNALQQLRRQAERAEALANQGNVLQPARVCCPEAGWVNST